MNMMRHIFISCLLLSLVACQSNSPSNQQPVPQKSAIWQKRVDSILPLYGHRNWILVVDKAFPALAVSSGLTVINTDTDMLSVLRYTLASINNSTHVKPILYEDKELGFIGNELEPFMDGFKDSLQKFFKGRPVTAILHDSVFTQIAAAADQFQVLVLKTNNTRAYSSVYVQLDCKYWDSQKEDQLRQHMKAGH